MGSRIFLAFLGFSTMPKQNKKTGTRLVRPENLRNEQYISRSAQNNTYKYKASMVYIDNFRGAKDCKSSEALRL
jgi:hypothetical protein